MSNRDASVVISIQSGSSERTLTSLSDKTRALDKDSQLLKDTTDALAEANKSLMKEQTKLQAQLKLSQKEVDSLQKAYDEYGDEMMKLDLDQAIENHAKLKEELSEVNAQIGANQKTYKEYLEIVRKGSMEEQGTSLKDVAKGMSAGQIGQMFSSSLGGLAQSVFSSAIGIPEASLISDTLSNTISGAAAGAAFGTPGIIGGALLGGASGLLTGGTKIFEGKNDAFKSYYTGLYDDVKGLSGEMVESGSSLASSRETDQISFATLFGSKDAAKRYLSDLTDMANSTPFLYDDLVGMSKTLATYGYNEKNILPLLQTVGDAGAALGMSTGDMDAVAQALGRMKSSDKATLEYLNMLNDRGIGAVGMLAQAKGVSQGDMYDMISDGKISGTEAVEIITAALKEAYSGAMAEQAQTFAGLSSTLEGLQQNLDAQGGEGYNTLRSEGKQAEINALSGDLGDAIGEINAIMAENQARRENLQDQYIREAVDTVLLGNRGTVFTTEEQVKLNELASEYGEAKRRYEESGGTDAEAAAQMERLYEEAQVLGQAYYDNSDFVKILNETEQDEIEAIREATAGLKDAYTALYDLNQTMSKGLVVHARALTVSSDDERGLWDEEGRWQSSAGYDEDGVWKPHAFGLNRVPYDEYPALLHQGERVLTASEARAQDAEQRGGLTIPITGNTFVGASEEMADQLWEIIVRKLEQAYTAAAPK